MLGEEKVNILLVDDQPAKLLGYEVTVCIYEIEVDAMHAWLRNLVAFDAYCARRARP